MDSNVLKPGPAYPSYLFGPHASNAAWPVVYRAYLDDKVEAAYEAAIELGTPPGGGTVHFYRQVEAEAETRRHSTIRNPKPWLFVEGREIVDDHVMRAIERVIVDTAKRFGFEDRPNTLVTILLEEVDTPWAVGRSGYFVDKTPYDKICIPEVTLKSYPRFVAVLAHEYAHLIALHLAEGHAPRWLSEAFATLSEGYEVHEAVSWLRSGTSPWRNETDLNNAFIAPENDEKGQADRSEAYGQAAIMGRYIQSLKGDTGFADLLRGFANNPRWKDLAMLVTGQEPVDEALREVFGFGVRELFDRAKPA